MRSATLNAASGGQYEWKRKWFSPHALAVENTFSQPASSVGGVPVSGKMQHSNVPRRNIRLPLMVR